MAVRIRPLALLFSAWLSVGCAAAPVAPTSGPDKVEVVPRPDGAFTSSEGGFSIEMPAAVTEQRSAEGRVEMVAAKSSDGSGAVHEAAYFDIPESLNDERKVQLVAKVILALREGPGVHDAALHKARTAGIPSAQLDLALHDRVRGSWRLFFVKDRRMFQLSVVGPADGEHLRRAEQFFSSFQLGGPPEINEPGQPQKWVSAPKSQLGFDGTLATGGEMKRGVGGSLMELSATPFLACSVL